MRLGWWLRVGFRFGCCCVVAAGLLAGCHEAKQGVEPAGPRIEGDRIVYPAGALELASLTTVAASAAGQDTVRTTGRLAWDEDRTARVFPPVGGRVRQLIADLEQRVRPGSPLAAVESPDFGQAQADASRAQTDLEVAERNLARERELYEHQAAPQKDLESAVADRDRAKAENQRARSHLALLGGTPGAVDQRFVLRSPIAGTVVDRAINPGLEVQPGAASPLFVISDPSRLWVFLDVVEQELPQVRAGQELVLHSTAWPGRAFRGRVEVVGDSLDPATRTVKARGVLDNPDHLLKAEMYVQVEVEVGTAATAGAAGAAGAAAVHPAVQIPSAAVVADGDRHYVFVEEAPGRFERRAVQTGAERAGESQVLAGLAAGQRVVVDGSLLLQSLMTPGA